MTSCLVSSLVRCSIPRVSFIYRSQFYSTTPLISRTWILRNLICKPCCPIFTRSVSSKKFAAENDKIKHANEILLRVLESEIAEHELEKVLPKDFPFEIIDNPEGGSIMLKREYGTEQIQATVSAYSYMGTPILLMYLNITIKKNVGPTLEIFCHLRPNDFQTILVSLENPEISKSKSTSRRFQRRFQRDIHKYLAARGFEISLYDYLCDCLISTRKKQSGWLKSFKHFIDN